MVKKKTETKKSKGKASTSKKTKPPKKETVSSTKVAPKRRKKGGDLKKTVKLKIPKTEKDSTLQETALILMHHQQVLIELLLEKNIFTFQEFENQVDKEISRSLKL